MREWKTVGIVLGLLVLVALLGSALGSGMMGGVWPGGRMGPGMMWWYGENAAPGAGRWVWGLGVALGMLGTLAFWAAIIVGIALVARWAFGRAAGTAAPGGPEEPLAILRRRYAAGEIDQATFERMKRELEA